MDIGHALSLSGTADGERSEPATWRTLRRQAQVAEEVGFDVLIAEDALSMPDPDRPTLGYLDADTVLRCYLHPFVEGCRTLDGRVELVERMQGVVERVHAG